MIGTKKEIINYILDKDDNIKFEIKEHKEKRGLKANAYHWKLCNEMAHILKTSDEELHFELLKKYGVMDYISLRADIPAKDYFKYYVEDKHYMIGSQEMASYRVYKESHLMDTKEFSHLLEMTIQDARELGIEILEDTKIQKMMEEYEKGMIK